MVLCGLLLECEHCRALARAAAHHVHSGPRTDMTHLHRFASDFAVSRALSMKSCTTGPSARFFSVTIPLGNRAIGSLTGKILISERLLEKRSAEAGKTVR